MAAKRDPFDVTLTAEQREAFAIWLSEEIQAGLDARGVHEREVAYWHAIYEQARTRSAKMAPWPNAADLTSYLATQNVDSLHARLMKTVWVEPVCTVEGWGPSASNAPFVEEAHQWWCEEEGLQSVLDKLALVSLIEPRGLLEVREGTEERWVRKTVTAPMALDEMSGMPVFDAKGIPQMAFQPDGSFQKVQGPEQATATVVADVMERVRTGPQYRVLPYRDSLVLPGHARDEEEIWGWGKRFWRRQPDLEQAVEDGLYDREAVERLHTGSGDRQPDSALQRAKMGIAPQEGPTVEKELWEVLVLADPDGKGERWYLATVNIDQMLLLRLQYDDLDRSRFVLVNLFPRPDRATEGFSFVGHKIITTVEEHTAWRNMIADRAALALQAPILRQTGALWDPLEQPFGPTAVIDVRDPRELTQLPIQDVPQSAIERERAMERTAERLAGVNDIASGQFAQESKTLGEIQMATEQSFIRMDLVIRRFQESLEDLFQIRHAIRKRMLAESPDGVDLPASSMIGLTARGMELPGGKMTAQLLEGDFRFKPRGSVETADPRANKADYMQFLQGLPVLMQAMQPIAAAFGPQAAQALVTEFLRVNKFPNKQAFLQGAQQMTQMLQPQPPQGMLPPAAPQPLPMPGTAA